MDENNITSTNFDYDIYSGGSSEAAVNELYAEEQKEIARAEKLAKKAKKNKLDLTGVESVTDENIDSLIYGEGYYPEEEPEPVGMEEPITPLHNDLTDRAQTYRNSQPPEGFTQNPYAQAAPPQQAQQAQAQQQAPRQPMPQKPIPEYQVGANDPYATDNFQSTYTDTSNYQAEAMAAQLRGQSVVYGQQMYGSSPQQTFGQYDPQMPQQPYMQQGQPNMQQQGQPYMQQGQPYAQTSPYDAQGRYDPQNVYGQNRPVQQQAGMTREQGIAMVDQMMSQDRMMSRGSLYTGSGPRYSGRSTSAVRPGMSKRERGLAQVDQMMAQDRASHQTTDQLVSALNKTPYDLPNRGMYHASPKNIDEIGGGGDMAWYFLWFAAGALIPFGAFTLPFEFCIIIGAVFGLIGAVILHNGKEGFDLRTSLSMSKTELLLIPICAVIGVALYFFY